MKVPVTLVPVCLPAPHIRAMQAAVLAVSVAIASLPGITTAAHAAQAEILELSPDLQSKVARERIKQRGPRRGTGNNDSDSENCGQVDIGNNNKANNSARNRVNPRGQTVIVTGPVINAARCR